MAAGTLHPMRALLTALLLALPMVAVPAASARDAAIAARADEFPEDWFWRLGATGTKHKSMTGKPAPKLHVKSWSGSERDTKSLAAGDALASLKGKVVVIDFWATWCGPCRAALPENVTMVRDLGSKGLVVLGVHDPSRGFETMDKVAKAAGVEYPLAVDDGGKSVKSYAVGFWPTYAVVDRAGMLRAIGLQPQHVRKVVEKLLKEPAPDASTKDVQPSGPNLAKPASDDTAQPTDEAKPAKPVQQRVAPVSRNLLEGDARRRSTLARFDLCPTAPELAWATQWTNTTALGDARKIAEMQGKIVVLDFWATWCGPCIASIPHMNEMAKKYADKGVVFIGVCRPDGAEKMRDLVDSKKIAYPLCVDSKGEINAAYGIDGYPDYVVIDRQGRVRGADVANASVESALAEVLADK